jgi:uncharacterized cupin superfamily protein
LSACAQEAGPSPKPAEAAPARPPQPPLDQGGKTAPAAAAKAGQPKAGNEAAPGRIVVRKPAPGELERLGAAQWPIWTHKAGDLPWTYEETETCYILEGEVTVDAEGQKVSFGPGDLVILPKGLTCVWKIHKPVKKHYRFE